MTFIDGLGGLVMAKWREAKNERNDYTYILFDGVFTSRYKVSAFGFNAKKGDGVTYKAQQIGENIWLSVSWRYVAPTLLKRILCGVAPLTNDEIYQIAVKHI